MSAMDLWKKASSPNYETNKDKLYPYSEIPFQNEYKLVKIPICVKNLIEHVDYFGCGKINLAEGIRGFSNCYNVNYEFRLVTFGPDKGRKIPNRIPMSEGTSFGYSTRQYLKDNSVRTVTINCHKEVLTEIIFEDIVRIVNSERGEVIVYDYDYEQIKILTDELRKMKQLFYCPIYNIPDNLRLNYCSSVYAFVGINELKKLLYGNVMRGDIEAAVILTGCLTDIYCGGALADIVNKLLANNVANVIVYAYKLWNNNDKEVVREHFPSVFQHIFDGDNMDIINYQNNQALVLEPKTTKARGDGHYKSSNKSGWRWKIIPTWDENKVFFKLYNIDSDMYLQLSPTAGEDGVRQATGSENSKELSDKFYFEPLIINNGQVAFHIFNNENKRLELPVDVDTSEVKTVVGHKSVENDQVHPDPFQRFHSSSGLTTSSQDRVGHKSVENDQAHTDRFQSFRSSSSLSTSSQDRVKSYKIDEQAQSEDEDFST